MNVNVICPSRADFAGGTLDLYPLYLFMDGGTTVNAGITVYSRVNIKTRTDKEIHIYSQDLDVKAAYPSIDKLDLKGPTSFIQRAIRSYAPKTGIEVLTSNEAPKGSGLGASSSLLMALSAGLIKVSGGEIDNNRMIDRGAAIEAAHLGIPTGKQDYYGAVLGKIHALHFDETGCTPEEIPVDREFKNSLDRSLIVSFTGISHYSGANNWDMLKMTIERTGSTYENLLKIKEISGNMRNAFFEHDLEKVGRLVSEEWECRKNLAPGVTTPFIDEVMQGLDRIGSWGSKLCGAGGGGCMISIVPPERREEAIQILTDSGVHIMPARITEEGLKVTVSD